MSKSTKRLYNIINPAGDYYAEPPKNHRTCYSWLARGGIIPPLSYAEDDMDFFRYNATLHDPSCMTVHDPNGHARIVTGSQFADSMQRSNAKPDPNDMFLTYPSQKVDTHVKEADRCGNHVRYWKAYLVGALLGRNFGLLHPALLCAMRRCPPCLHDWFDSWHTQHTS